MDAFAVNKHVVLWGWKTLGIHETAFSIDYFLPKNDLVQLVQIEKFWKLFFHFFNNPA